MIVKNFKYGEGVLFKHKTLFLLELSKSKDFKASNPENPPVDGKVIIEYVSNLWLRYKNEEITFWEAEQLFINF